MASFSIDFSEDFLSSLLGTEFDEIAEEALTEAAPILAASMKRSCRDAIRHEGDSELVDSIKAGRPRRTRTDAMIVTVQPKGNSKVKVRRTGKKKERTEPVSNVLKAIWLENGIPGHQSPRPFLTAATNDARAAVEKKLQEVYDRKVGK